MRCLTLFELLGQDTEREHLGLGHRFIGTSAIGQHTRQLSNFGQPTPVAFALTLKSALHPRLLGEIEFIAEALGAQEADQWLL